MRNKWIKRLFPIIALLLLLPWPVAYAIDSNTVSSQDSIQIEIAEPPAEPAYTVFGRSIGGLSNPVDLFYINATNNTADIVTTLYLTNSQELIKHYSYLILHVGVYVKSNGEWQMASSSNGEPISDTIITMRNGQVSFVLPGYAEYKVTIDSGSFYSPKVTADSSSLSPQFYLEVN